jgi:cytoskeletal protein CcmA (bactofilin family)
MSSFRQYGGLNRAATNNIVRNQYSNSDNPTISNFLGLYNSKIVSESHIDLSGNSILNINGIYFDNGTTIIDGSFNGDLTVNGNLEVTKSTKLDGSLNVFGDVSLNSTLEVAGDVLFDSSLNVAGTTTSLFFVSGSPIYSNRTYYILLVWI